MGFKFGKGIISGLGGVASGVAHGAVSGIGGVGKILSTIGGSNNQPQGQGQPSYTSSEDPQGQIRNIYGDEASRMSEGVGKYMSGLRGNLDKNVANADIYNQEAGRERGIADARAGLSGADRSIDDEQSRRNSIYGAAGINEAAKRDANTAYGKGVGNIISGVNRIEQQAKANSIASMPVPVAQEKSGGLLDSLFGWI